MMDLTNFVDYAKSFQTEINMRLEGILCLLGYLGNPHKGMKYIHVAGTNGKGSVCAFLDEMMISDGLKTGRFSSPELIKKNEVIRISGKEISDDDLTDLLAVVNPACEKVQKEIGLMPSPFEVITAAAFLHFKNQRCEWVILETGMGGRDDATNVVEDTAICIITQIALDHIAYLGGAIKEIASVKSGIIKYNSKVITTANNSESADIISQRCSQQNAELLIADGFESGGFEDIYEKINYKGKLVKLSIGGAVQLDNAALAVRAAELIGLSEGAIIYGLEHAVNPARLEKIRENLYFDGAHNTNGAAALRKSLDRYFPNKKKVFVMGAMADKDFEQMLKILYDGVSDFYFITVPDNPRAMKAEDMAAIAERNGIPAKAVKRLSDVKTKKGIVIVCGSLYLYKYFNESLQFFM